MRQSDLNIIKNNKIQYNSIFFTRVSSKSMKHTVLRRHSNTWHSGGGVALTVLHFKTLFLMLFEVKNLCDSNFGLLKILYFVFINWDMTGLNVTRVRIGKVPKKCHVLSECPLVTCRGSTYQNNMLCIWNLIRLNNNNNSSNNNNNNKMSMNEENVSLN